jgi:hypothetical protein
MFLGEFKDIFILLLIVASVFSVAIGYYEFQLPPLPGEPPEYLFEAFADSLIIFIIVILVAVARARVLEGECLRQQLLNVVAIKVTE